MIDELESIKTELTIIKDFINSDWYRVSFKENSEYFYNAILEQFWIKECHFSSSLELIRKLYKTIKDENNPLYLLLEPIGKNISFINKAYMQAMDFVDNPVVNPKGEWLYFSLTSYQNILITFDKTIRYKLSETIQSLNYLILFIKEKGDLKNGNE